MRQVIVLRPQPGASETMARAQHLGLDAVSIPLFDIEPLQWAEPDPNDFDGLLLTSANAVRGAGSKLQNLRDLPVYAVGDSTAAAARQAGLGTAAIGGSGVDQLLGAIDPKLRLLHLCGEERKIPATVAPTITAVAVYRARTVAKPDLTAAIGAIVLVHSERAGQRLAELLDQRSSTAIVAISDAAAAAVGTHWDRIEVAGRPSDQALLALAARLCNKTAA